MKKESWIFIAIGVGLIWWVLDHQTTPQDVIDSASGWQLIQTGTQKILGPGLPTGPAGSNPGDLPPDDSVIGFG